MPYWFLPDEGGTMSPATYEEMSDTTDLYVKVQSYHVLCHIQTPSSGRHHLLRHIHPLCVANTIFAATYTPLLVANTPDMPRLSPKAYFWLHTEVPHELAPVILHLLFLTCRAAALGVDCLR